MPVQLNHTIVHATDKRRYQRTATTITSGGNRKPANADLGGEHERADLRDLTAQACLDHATGQRNSALMSVGTGGACGASPAVWLLGLGPAASQRHPVTRAE